MSPTPFTEIAQKAKQASRSLPTAREQDINNALGELAKLLLQHEEEIISVNQNDIKAGQKNGLTDALIDRLTLTSERIQGISSSLKTIIELTDPIGEIISETTRPNGLLIQKVRVPIGVIGMIYESRPNVTIDAAALCLKSHNAVILRGGSECFETNKFLHSLIVKALENNNIPPEVVSFVPTTDREMVSEMLHAHHYIDVLIPRGGRGLTEKVQKEARMPVFSHLDGICHIYVHHSAKPDIARAVIVNAKMRRPGICGAMETLLLDTRLPPPQKKDLVNQLIKAGCEVRADEEIQKLDKRVLPATYEDWTTEYLAPIVSVRVIENVDEAIEHINTFGSHHTDSIIAEDPEAVDSFLTRIDSGIVMHNTSTQFADGGEFGMGAEIGIATGKLHARGPVGLEQLTTYKYRVLGDGHIRP